MIKAEVDSAPDRFRRAADPQVELRFTDFEFELLDPNRLRVSVTHVPMFDLTGVGEEIAGGLCERANLLPVSLFGTYGKGDLLDEGLIFELSAEKVAALRAQHPQIQIESNRKISLNIPSENWVDVTSSQTGKILSNASSASDVLKSFKNDALSQALANHPVQREVDAMRKRVLDQAVSASSLPEIQRAQEQVLQDLNTHLAPQKSAFESLRAAFEAISVLPAQARASSITAMSEQLANYQKLQLPPLSTELAAEFGLHSALAQLQSRQEAADSLMAEAQQNFDATRVALQSVTADTDAIASIRREQLDRWNKVLKAIEDLEDARTSFDASLNAKLAEQQLADDSDDSAS